MSVCRETFVFDIGGAVKLVLHTGFTITNWCKQISQERRIKEQDFIKI
jgi:hypothetical protein